MYESRNPQRSACACNESRCPAKADTGPQHTAFRSPAPKGPPQLGPHKSKSLRHEPFGKDTPSFGDQCRIYPKTHLPWEKLAAALARDEKEKLCISLVPRRHDTIRFRLTGTGQMTLRSVSRTFAAAKGGL